MSRGGEVLSRAHDEACAVVGDLRADLPRVERERDADAGRARVSLDVPERLLNDPEEDELGVGRGPPLAERDVEVHLHPVPFGGLGEEPPHGADEAELLEVRRTERPAEIPKRCCTTRMPRTSSALRAAGSRRTSASPCRSWGYEIRR